MKKLSNCDSPLLFPDPLAGDGSNAGPDYSIEQYYCDHGRPVIAGVDEVGRGPLAGPVVAACVILDPLNIPGGLNDSKKLSAKKREGLFEEILITARVSISSIPAKLIDQINIRQASLLAMTRSCMALESMPDILLVDGRDCPPGLPVESKAFIKGDGRSVSIAAASIVAKVVRDRQMIYASTIYPQYGFEGHKGYGSKAHLAALEKHGPCPLHRFSFSPLRDKKKRRNKKGTP